MAMYPREEFVRQVLVELGVLDATEAPEAEDAVFVSGRTQQKLEELYEEGLIPFDLAGEIPARYFLSLVALVAAECLTAYGQTAKLPEIAAKAAGGYRQLWKLRQGPYAGNPTQATYF